MDLLQDCCAVLASIVALKQDDATAQLIARLRGETEAVRAVTARTTCGLGMRSDQSLMIPMQKCSKADCV